QPDHSSHLDGFSPDGRTLVTMTYPLIRDGEGDRYGAETIRVWELASGKERLTITNAGAEKGFSLSLLAYAPDGRTLATARADRIIQLWDVATGKEVLRRTGYDAAAWALAFAPDGRRLASGHGDSTILVWDLAPVKGRSLPHRPLSDQELDRL